MLETPDETAALQSLLDASHARASGHLRSIVDDDHTLTAEQLVGLLTGMKVLSVATVTASGEPRISALDGHFLHGTWTFSTDGSAAKARHMQARPAISVAYIDDEEMAVFSHGRGPGGLKRRTRRWPFSPTAAPSGCARATRTGRRRWPTGPPTTIAIR